MAVASKDVKKRGVAGWYPGGDSELEPGPGNDGVRGLEGVGISDGDR